MHVYNKYVLTTKTHTYNDSSPPIGPTNAATHLDGVKMSDECVREDGFELPPTHVAHFHLNLLPTATSSYVSATSARSHASQVSRVPCQVSITSACHLTSLLFPDTIW